MKQQSAQRAGTVVTALFLVLGVGYVVRWLMEPTGIRLLLGLAYLIAGCIGVGGRVVEARRRRNASKGVGR
jgi:hypothetical protein